MEYVENENGIPPSVQAEINKKRKEGFEVPGLSFKTEDRRLAVYLDGKKQNAATLPHEMIHTFARDAAPEMRDRLSAAMGLPDSSEAAWKAEGFTSRTGRKINAREKLAEYWEDYLSKRRGNIPAEIKWLFDRLARAIKRVFDALGWKAGEAPPELQAIFDEITSGEYTENLRKTGEEARSGAQNGNRVDYEGRPLFAAEYADNEGMKPEKIIRKVKSISEAQKILEKFVVPTTKTFTNEVTSISASLTKKVNS